MSVLDRGADLEAHISIYSTLLTVSTSFLFFEEFNINFQREQLGVDINHWTARHTKMNHDEEEGSLEEDCESSNAHSSCYHERFP